MKYVKSKSLNFALGVGLTVAGGSYEMAQLYSFYDEGYVFSGDVSTYHKLPANVLEEIATTSTGAATIATAHIKTPFKPNGF